MEVQGNKVIDLLSEPSQTGKQPLLRVLGDQVMDAWVEKVHSSRGLTQMIERGMSRRTTQSNANTFTTQNVHSSRSHAFLTLVIKRHLLNGSQIVRTESPTTISLVDLAGSEKFDLEGKKVGAFVNGDLLALGKVLTALKEAQHHVPFRDSLLTQMLRSSLKGTCVTRVLACINPGTIQFPETRNVLLYVKRASSVRFEEEEEEGGEGGEATLDPEDSSQDAAKGDDPMEDDVFDTDEAQNRRCEMVETTTFGSIFARRACNGYNGGHGCAVVTVVTGVTKPLRLVQSSRGDPPFVASATMHHNPWKSTLLVIFSSPCQSYQLVQKASLYNNGLQIPCLQVLGRSCRPAHPVHTRLGYRAWSRLQDVEWSRHELWVRNDKSRGAAHARFEGAARARAGEVEGGGAQLGSSCEGVPSRCLHAAHIFMHCDAIGGQLRTCSRQISAVHLHPSSQAESLARLKAQATAGSQRVELKSTRSARGTKKPAATAAVKEGNKIEESSKEAEDSALDFGHDDDHGSARAQPSVERTLRAAPRTL